MYLKELKLIGQMHEKNVVLVTIVIFEIKDLSLNRMFAIVVMISCKKL